MLKLKLQ